MLIRATNQEILKMYTIEKRNIRQTERILQHKVRYRLIRLYSKDYYLPNGAKHYIQTIQNLHTILPIDIEFNGQLREDQVQGFMHVVENDGGIVQGMTGSGKSIIMLALIAFYKKKTLIITPTKKLVKEMVDKFKEFTNYTPGTFYSDGKDIKDITITTQASFVQDTLGDKELGKYDIILSDEFDVGISPSMISALCYSDCNILVGLSGTPRRQDMNTQDLELIFGPHIKIGDYQLLPDTITHYVYKWNEYEKALVDYSSRHYTRESILANRTRFVCIVKQIQEIENKSFLTLVLLDRISEIERFKKEFPHAVVITGKTKVKDDESQIDTLRVSGGLILGSIKKMYRGVDIHQVDSVIICSPVKFESTVIQAIGRCLRKCETKGLVGIHIFNDSILASQRYEQSRVCEKEYLIKPNVIYIQPTILGTKDEKM